ncbi:MAG: hypothetical protein QM767_03405 [Anaeromyxobacter sp.]
MDTGNGARPALGASAWEEPFGGTAGGVGGSAPDAEGSAAGAGARAAGALDRAGSSAAAPPG